MNVVREAASGCPEEAQHEAFRMPCPLPEGFSFYPAFFSCLIDLTAFSFTCASPRCVMISAIALNAFIGSGASLLSFIRPAPFCQ